MASGSMQLKIALLLNCLIAAQVLVAQTPATVTPSITAEMANGGIEASFPDGTKKMLSKDKICARLRVSDKGDVGWSTWNDTNNSGMGHSGETLHIYLYDGTTKDFVPNSRFIRGWNFVDEDSAIVIASMDYHGPTYFVKYDLTTGKQIDSVDEYKSYDELPQWAQPFSDD